MTTKLGNTPINKIYLGNTEIKKLYLGDTLIYGDNEEDTDWIVSEGGATLSRSTFPYTIKNLDYISHPEYGNILANTQLDISNIGLENNLTVVVDGSTLSGTSGLYARDCTAVISASSGTTPTSLNCVAITEPIPGDFDYMYLDKEGKVIEVLDHYLPYNPEYPADFLTYDSVNNTFTLASGTYDASTRYNNPETLASPVILNNTGGLMWADSNWEYMISFFRDSGTYTLLSPNYPSGYRAPVTNIYAKYGTMRSSNLYLGTSNGYTKLSTTYTSIPSSNLSSGGSVYFSYNLSVTGGYNWLSTGDKYYLKLDIDNTRLDSTKSYKIRIYGLKKKSNPYTQYTSQDVILHYPDNTTETVLTGITDDGYYSILTEKLIAATSIEIVFTCTTACDRIACSAVSVSLQYSQEGAMSKAVGISTEWGLEVGNGQYQTGYYVNINADDTIQSVTTSPIYPVR